MEKGKFYITTPIYYPSDKLHIGHTYCTVATDAIARYKRMCGYDVMFLTGTDEHGQKIEEKAKAAGLTPKEFVDKIVEGPGGITDLWKLMNISNDRFIRTTDDYHVQAVQRIFKKMYDKGDIYKGAYKGMYCTPCESFWTESQLKDGKCPDCGREVHYAEEEAYFFRLSKYAKPVQELLESGTFLEPASRVNEMINNFIKPGLEDLCVSRTSFTWGMEVGVNIETGEVKLVNCGGFYDAGRVLNRKTCEGQIEGALSMGLGQAIFEEIMINDQGRVINGNYRDYKIPTFMDSPTNDKLHVDFVGDPFPTGPNGAKGVGEVALIPVMAAFANAIYAATGAEIHNIPMTRERILQSLRDKEAAKEA